MSLPIMAWTSGVLLLAAFVALSVRLKRPHHGARAGDDAMAEGCGMFIRWIIAGAGVVLALAAAFSVRWLVYGIFVITAGLAAWITPFLIVELWKDHRKRVAA